MQYFIVTRLDVYYSINELVIVKVTIHITLGFTYKKIHLNWK